MHADCAGCNFFGRWARLGGRLAHTDAIATSRVLASKTIPFAQLLLPAPTCLH